MTATTITRTAATSVAAPGARRDDARDIARDAVILAFRLVIGFLYGVHAVMPFGAFGGMDGQGTAAEVGSMPWVVGSIQLVGAVLIAVGFWTRPAAFLLSGIMAGAYFMVHQPLGALPVLNQGEPAALYSWVFLLLVAIGPGRYALDTLRRR
jgi:putative oxidoreductase